VHGCDLENDIPLVTGAGSAISTSQVESGRAIVEDSIKTNQGKLTPPGRPEVRFK